MMLKIQRLIDPQQLQIMQQAIREAPFVDGKLTAGKAAVRVKNNQEIAQSTETALHLGKIIVGNLYNNATFRSATLPNRLAAPIIAKYTQNMGYGDHIDDPIMGENERFRSDIAVTVFLNDPQDYEGGELVVHTNFGEQKTKLSAGDAVIYPASSLHRVNDVTRGERIVAVTWIQSLIRDPHKREILHHLNLAREKLLLEKPGAMETKQVDHSYVNLVRLWAET